MNLQSDVLVLNSNFLPLNVTKVRRSMMLIINGKAELIEHKDENIHTSNDSFAMPSIIRLFTYIKPFNRTIKMTRSELFTRDQQRCQYCGLVTKDLTLDHVLPRSRGGLYIWENIVSACIKCNHKKAGRTPKEASMRLLTKPASPPHDPYYPFYRFLDNNKEWIQWVPAKRVR